jgi:hypothetical protein
MRIEHPTKILIPVETALILWRNGWFTTRKSCAWCGKYMGGNPFAHKVSHGICPPCRSKWITSLKPLRGELDEPEKPFELKTTP